MTWDDVNTAAMWTSIAAVVCMIGAPFCIRPDPVLSAMVSAIGFSSGIAGLVMSIIVAHRQNLNEASYENIWAIIGITLSSIACMGTFWLFLKACANEIPNNRARRNRRALERADWVLKWLHLQGFTLSRYNEKKVTPTEGRAVVARLWARDPAEETDNLMPRQRGGELATV